jgi:WD40 repeat protein
MCILYLGAQFRRVALPGDAYAEAEPVDLGILPRDLDVAAKCPEITIVPTETAIFLLHKSTIVSKTEVSYIATAAALSPDGTEAIVGGQDGKLYIYAVKGDTLTQEAILERHRGEITAVRYSPDGSMIASADQNREALIWDQVTREVRFIIISFI